jgi:deaminated glutathione amidase
MQDFNIMVSAVKVAVIELCSSNDVDQNLKIVSRKIEIAAALGAKLLVLPENFAYMGVNDRDKISIAEQVGVGKIQEFLSSQARLHRLIIVAGSIAIKSPDPNRVFATCFVYDESGLVIARYNKIHLFDVTLSAQEKYQESASIIPGDTIVSVMTSIGKIGLAICYDIRFPALFNQLGREKVDMIAVPAAFTTATGKAHWQLLARARAVENLCYFLGACQGGLHVNGRQTFGHSLIVNPWGLVIAENNEHNEGVSVAEIDFDYLAKVRKMLPALVLRDKINL